MVIRSAPCAAILMLATPVLAKSPQEQMFPGSTSCYARSYTAEHLATHPAQQVTGISVSPVSDFAEPLLGLVLALDLRNVPGGGFTAYAACENEGADTLFCLLEGDAGGFQITPAKDGAILIKVSTLGMTLENEDVFITINEKTGDDRSFLLPSTACH